MTGGPSITYNAPPPDNTATKFLRYVFRQDKAANERAAAIEAENKAKEEAYNAAGAAAYPSFKSNIQLQLQKGLIGLPEATQSLSDFATKYKMAPPAEDANLFTQEYIAALPGRRGTQIGAAYQELLGRAATEQELSDAQTRWEQGYYTDIGSLKESITKSSEYQEKFNDNYLDNYYDTMFGKQTVDEQGKRTGLRTLKFDASLLPKYTGELADKTKVTAPDFDKEYTGNVYQLQEQIQNIRDTRQYLYSAGLTNLQGEIDTQIQKLRNEGTKDVAKISAKSNVYSNLVSGFWG